MGFFKKKIVQVKCYRERCKMQAEQEEGSNYAAYCSDSCRDISQAKGKTVCYHCEGPMETPPGFEDSDSKHGWKDGPNKRLTGKPGYSFREGKKFWQKKGCVGFCSQACSDQRIKPDPAEWDTPEWVAAQEEAGRKLLEEMNRDPEGYRKKMERLAKASHRSQVMEATRGSQAIFLEITTLRKEVRQHREDAAFAKKMGHVDSERAHTTSADLKEERAKELELEATAITEQTKVTSMMITMPQAEPEPEQVQEKPAA
jgi:hypothetical protein